MDKENLGIIQKGIDTRKVFSFQDTEMWNAGGQVRMLRRGKLPYDSKWFVHFQE